MTLVSLSCPLHYILLAGSARWPLMLWTLDALVVLSHTARWQCSMANDAPNSGLHLLLGEAITAVYLVVEISRRVCARSSLSLIACRILMSVFLNLLVLAGFVGARWIR